MESRNIISILVTFILTSYVLFKFMGELVPIKEAFGTAHMAHLKAMDNSAIIERFKREILDSLKEHRRQMDFNSGRKLSELQRHGAYFGEEEIKGRKSRFKSFKKR